MPSVPRGRRSGIPRAPLRHPGGAGSGIPGGAVVNTYAHAQSGHARAAARFVQLATRFGAQIQVHREGKVMDGKSIMGILLLSASRGTTLTISADGQDESAAVDALCQLVESGFEDSWSV